MIRSSKGVDTQGVDIVSHPGGGYRSKLTHECNVTYPDDPDSDDSSVVTEIQVCHRGRHFLSEFLAK